MGKRSRNKKQGNEDLPKTMGNEVSKDTG